MNFAPEYIAFCREQGEPHNFQAGDWYAWFENAGDVPPVVRCVGAADSLQPANRVRVWLPLLHDSRAELEQLGVRGTGFHGYAGRYFVEDRSLLQGFFSPFREFGPYTSVEEAARRLLVHIRAVVAAEAQREAQRG